MFERDWARACKKDKFAGGGGQGKGGGKGRGVRGDKQEADARDIFDLEESERKMFERDWARASRFPRLSPASSTPHCCDSPPLRANALCRLSGSMVLLILFFV